MAAKHVCIRFDRQLPDKYTLCDVRDVEDASNGKGTMLEGVLCEQSDKGGSERVVVAYTIQSGQSFTIGSTTINISFSKQNRSKARFGLPPLRAGGTIWPSNEFPHRKLVRCVSFANDARLIVSGDDSGDIVVRRTATGKKVKTHPNTDKGACCCISISNNSKYLASGHIDGSVVVRDIKTGAVLKRFRHTKNVRSLCFSPTNELQIAVVDKAKHVVIHDIIHEVCEACRDDPEKDPDKCTHTTKLLLPKFKHGDYVRAVAYSSDGKYITTGDDDGKVLVRDAVTSEIIREFLVPGYIYSLCYLCNGDLAVGTAKGVVHIFRAAVFEKDKLWKKDLDDRLTELAKKGKAEIAEVGAVCATNDGKYIITLFLFVICFGIR